jgi:hypothetical protein
LQRAVAGLTLRSALVSLFQNSIPNHGRREANPEPIRPKLKPTGARKVEAVKTKTEAQARRLKTDVAQAGVKKMQATVETLQEQAATSYFVRACFAEACREWVRWSSVCLLQLSYIQRATLAYPWLFR